VSVRDEGVIKFDCRWMEAENLPQDQRISELIDVRNKLFDMNLIGVYPDGIGFGNISARVPGAASFVISASQTGHVAKCNAAHFTLVTTYSIRDNWVECIGPMRASSESLTHAMIYEVFHEATAVIHVHDNEHWQRLIGKIPTSDAAVPYGTPEMADEVRRLSRESDLRQSLVMVMAGHEDGILSFGAGLGAALDSLTACLQNN
jgi:L-ribulose-5-phosphate 4-epimerase